MARRSKKASRPRAEVQDYRHDATRKNNPPIGLASYEPAVRETPTRTYVSDPHLSPQLVWAGKPGLRAIEVEDAAGVEVETVPLHIHERVSARAIIDAARRPEPKQLGLFADPQLPLGEAVQFYQHDVDWANRLILGDSLVVMNSLLERELLGGKVQMIYFDPPYGVKYSSNFQPWIDRRDVGEDDASLTREPEVIKAYRDTWTLGIHSYLTYLRDRLRVARELLTESGSIFVQIGDENVHLVRCLMDEVFGRENFCGIISFKKTGAFSGKILSSICDYLIWYARNKSVVKFHHLYEEKSLTDGSGERYSSVELSDGETRPATPDEMANPALLPSGAKLFLGGPLTSDGASKTPQDFVFEGRVLRPPANQHWKTNSTGLARLAAAGRIFSTRTFVNFKLYHTDFSYVPLTNIWIDTMGTAERDKVYVVQTVSKVVARCLLMTTDPGDLVLDPTCGSGTTAYVAEQWGRRWITIDTSRVALALARQRLLTATFPYYKLAHPEQGVSGGFVYKTVPHITLKSIAQNTRIDPVAERYQPQIEAAEAAGDAELRGTLDPDRFAQMTGTTSFPFKPGQHRRVAVKVIDLRGNEVMRVIRI
ncbi:MAG: site-specific DNA-methyltransferase [Sphaerobacter sp.]|nr:site-specific DNA-methyltransferase [Sphaerobacter sp.]